jgi:hypothetical protein
MIPNEITVYLLRKTNLNFTEIEKLKRKLTPTQFYTLYQEVVFQESQEHWIGENRTAALIAALYNTTRGKKSDKVWTAKDILDAPYPSKDKGGDELAVLAQKNNIKLPSKEIRERD